MIARAASAGSRQNLRRAEIPMPKILLNLAPLALDLHQLNEGRVRVHACRSAKLIVELDRQSRDFDGRQKADETGDAFFAGEDFRVLRFSNHGDVERGRGCRN